MGLLLCNSKATLIER